MQTTSHWTIEIDRAILGQNAKYAGENRRRFHEAGLVVLNLVSSPGSGKTALLERTLAELRDQIRLGVHVGDLRTDNDARRLEGKGAPVVQIVTGGTCHLEASMVSRAADQFDLNNLDILIIENVGNLVCTASYDLGEDLRVVLLSVTEGEDKPLKYPVIFRNADLVLITKIDLAEAADADMPMLRDNVRKAAPNAEVIELSARSGQGMRNWYRYLLQARGRMHERRATGGH